MNVTKITIGRLFNLGDYEHVRYELTVEVPAGRSATTALIGLENIIEALNPKRPADVPDAGDIKQMEAMLAEVRSSTDEKCRKYRGRSKYALIHQLQREIPEAVKRMEQWKSRQRRARMLLNDLGGAAVWKDAKEDWDND